VNEINIPIRQDVEIPQINSQILFEYQFDRFSPKITFQLDPSSTLSEVLESFESFLRASGYVFDGMIDIIENEQIKGATNESA